MICSLYSNVSSLVHAIVSSIKFKKNFVMRNLWQLITLQTVRQRCPSIVLTTNKNQIKLILSTMIVNASDKLFSILFFAHATGDSSVFLSVATSQTLDIKIGPLVAFIFEGGVFYCMVEELFAYFCNSPSFMFI